MIKKCKIVLMNKECIVTEYDGELIQFPNKQNIVGSSVYVNNENGKYQLSSEDEYLRFSSKNEKVKKKTEENEEAKDVVEDDK